MLLLAVLLISSCYQIPSNDKWILRTADVLLSVICLTPIHVFLKSQHCYSRAAYLFQQSFPKRFR